MMPDRIRRVEARTLAEEEFRRFADLVSSLSPDDWARPTDCSAWDVRKIALHVLGSADAQASFPQFVHQLRRGVPLNKKIESHHWVDGMNELQIRERSHLSNHEIATQLANAGPPAVKGRWRTPPPMRYLPIPFGPPIGWAPLKYLLDVGFTRDVWAHRIDIYAAIGRDMPVTADHDGRLVADIVAEWASIHGEPFELVLEGSGRWALQPGHRRRAPSTSTPSSSSASSPVACPAPACSTIRSHSEGDHHGDPSQRDRRANLPPVHVRAGHRTDWFHLQPVPGRRRDPAPVPHRTARHVPVRLVGHFDRHADRLVCGGSPSAISRPTSAAP